MPSFISRKCENKECKSHTKLFSWSEKDPVASCQIIDSFKDGIRVRCESCGLEFDTNKVKQKSKATWPHYNASAGVTFDSYSDQRSYEKKNGLEPM